MEINDDYLFEYNYDTNIKNIHILANKYFEEKDYKWAIFLYNKLLETIVDDKLKSKIYSNKSACYLILKDFVKSLDNALLSVKFNKLNAKAWGRIGWSYKGLNNFKNALESFEIASKINSYNLNYKNEILFFKSKKINKMNLFDLFKTSKFIMNKLKNNSLKKKILSNMNNQDNLINDNEFQSLINHIIDKI